MATGSPGVDNQVDPAPSVSWLDGRPWTRVDVIAATIIGLLSVGLVWVLRTSIVTSDPWNYVQAAIAFPADTWVPLGYTRYGVILPLLPLTALFGDAEITYYFWPLVGSGLLAACLYLIGRRFWGPLAGGLAIVLALANPLVLPNLSRGYPDIQSTGVFFLAVVLCFRARDQRFVVGTAPAVPLLLAGFCLGWSFEARETSCLTWPIIAIILWDHGRELRRAIVLVAAAMATWAIADLAIGQFGYGDILMRVHAFTRQDLAATQLPGDQAVLHELVGRDRWFYLAAVPRYLTGATGGFWHLFVGVLGLVGLAFRRSRFVALWFLIAYLGFVGIAGGLSPDHPSGRIDIARYWIPFVVGAGLAAAGTTHEIAGRLFGLLERRRVHNLRITRRGVELTVAVLIAAGPVIGTALVTSTNTAYAVNGATQLSALRTHLAETTDEPITLWTDWSSKRVIPIYKRAPLGGRELWAGEVKSMWPTSKMRSGDYVVINSPTTDACTFCRLALNSYFEQGGKIKSSWQEVWSTPERNLILYRVS